MLYIYVTFYDILCGKTSYSTFSYRYHELEKKMIKYGIDIPFTLKDLDVVLPTLTQFTLENEDLYFCVMTDKKYNFSIIKHTYVSNYTKLLHISQEFKNRLDNQNIDKDFKL